MGNGKKEPWTLGREPGEKESQAVYVHVWVGMRWRGGGAVGKDHGEHISDRSFAKPSSDSAREKGRSWKRWGGLGFLKCTNKAIS